jgi:hypothetical protein
VSRATKRVVGVGDIDFSIGDTPPRVLSIDCWSHPVPDGRRKRELHVEIDLAFSGTAHVTFSANILKAGAFPVTLRKISMSNVRMSIVLKGLTDELPMVAGFQIFLVELPSIDWETGNAASRVLDLSIVNNAIKHLIETKIERKIVLPNRIVLPLSLPTDLVSKIEEAGFKIYIREDEEYLVAMPIPAGVVKVTAVRAENLKATDILGMAHCIKSKNLNPLKPRSFSLTELLPRPLPGDPYVKVRVGQTSHRSQTINNDLNPVFNFECEFPVDYCHETGNVKIEMFDDDSNVGGVNSDDPLGMASERISRIRERGTMENWYNCHRSPGRMLLRFEWIPLTVWHEDPVRRRGALAFLIGTVDSKEVIMPRCDLEVVDADGNTISSELSAEASEKRNTHRFDEGRVIRITDYGKADSIYLRLQVRDQKTGNLLGDQRFRLDGLLQNPLSGKHRLPIPNVQREPVFVTLYTAAYVDDSDQKY